MWPSKTQTSLYIHSVWQGFSLIPQNSPEVVEGMCDQGRLRSDCTDVQTDLSLLWSQKFYCRFFHSLTHFFWSTELCMKMWSQRVYYNWPLAAKAQNDSSRFHWWSTTIMAFPCLHYMYFTVTTISSFSSYSIGMLVPFVQQTAINLKYLILFITVARNR